MAIVMRFPLLDWLYLLFERFAVSLACWALGAQRDASQRADARRAALLRG